MPSGDDEHEWKLQRYEAFVGDPQAVELAFDLARECTPEGDEPPVLSDVHAARRYLRRCILNMSFGEVRGLSPDAAASLWARGTDGARRYRLQGNVASTPKRRR